MKIIFAAPTPTPTPEFFKDLGETFNTAGIMLCVAVVVVILIAIYLLFKTNDRGQ